MSAAGARFPAFEAAVADSFLDEELNARGELSARQLAALEQHAPGAATELALTKVPLEAPAFPRSETTQSLAVRTTQGTWVPIRPGLTVVPGPYEGFVTARPEILVGVARPRESPAEIVARYRRELLEVQHRTEEDAAAWARGKTGASERREETRVAIKLAGTLLAWMIPFFIAGLWAPVVGVIAGGFAVVPMALLLATRWLVVQPLQADDGYLIAVKPAQATAILECRTPSGAHLLVAAAAGDAASRLREGLPYRVYWRGRRTSGLVSSTSSTTRLPYREAGAGEAPGERRVLKSVVGIDLSDLPPRDAPAPPSTC